MILIIDDDPAVRASLTFLLKKEGLETAAVANPEDALPFFRSGTPRLVLMDMNFSRRNDGSEGLELLRKARIFLPEVPVILITAWGSINLAVEGMRLGAFDFITKPWDNRLLLKRISTALQITATDSGTEGQNEFDRCGIIGRSAALTDLLATAARVAASDAPVLILGENGTGKELIARAIHFNSRRAAGPFLEVNLGGIPASLFESEMFGHAKGAFTGAVSARKGRFEEADGGTIFLDEIGDLDPSAQVKMLRVLQEHTFQPLGESRSRHTDVRVISATNADLEKSVAERRFREDLFYRINLITLHLPPLRERREDIPLLVRHFMTECASRNRLTQPEISSEAMTRLTRLPWPGNIRQLKNAVERAMLVSGSGQIGIEDLDIPDPLESGVTMESSPSMPKGVTLADAERLLITGALDRHDWNLSKVALELGITRQTLYRKMEKFGIMR